MIISEVSGGKIEVKLETLKKKNTAHAYFEHRICLSFLAGKFKEMKRT